MVDQETIAGGKSDGNTLWCIKGLVAPLELQGHNFK